MTIFLRWTNAVAGDSSFIHLKLVFQYGLRFVRGGLMRNLPLSMTKPEIFQSKESLFYMDTPNFKSKSINSLGFCILVGV